MPVGGPSAGGGAGSAFGVRRTRMGISVAGDAPGNANWVVKRIPQINKFLLSAGGVQTYHRCIPMYCDDPRINAWELLPNYPKGASTTVTPVHLLTTPTHHFFNLRDSAVGEFWRATLDFSTWVNLSIPPNSPINFPLGWAYTPAGVLGPMIVYAANAAGPAWTLYYSVDAGVSWSTAGLPSGSIPSTWQAQAVLGATPAGNIILGVRNSICLVGPLVMLPPLTMPLIAASPNNVGTNGNSYTCFGIAPDGRCCAGVNTGQFNFSSDFGLNWPDSIFLTVGGLPATLRNIIHNPDDDYLYIQAYASVQRTRDFSDFEIVPQYAVPQASSRLVDEPGSGPIAGGFILTPDLTSPQPPQYWELS